MRKVWDITIALLLVVIISTGCSKRESDKEQVNPLTKTQYHMDEVKDLTILCIGNSFSVDTMQYIPDIALSLGVETVKVGVLYKGGCSIGQHHLHAKTNYGAYKYYTNIGDGWTSVDNYKISDAVKSEDWDWIVIQHGSGDGSRYTSEAAYEKIVPLIKIVKEMVGDNTKFAFNMTWMDDADKPRNELRALGGDPLVMYQMVVEVMKNYLLPLEELQCVSMTGTAIQNARTSEVETLTRDGYHLSYDTGRYIAGLTMFKTLTGMNLSGIEWAPEGIDEYAKKVAIESVENAFLYPFEVTQSEVKK